MTDLRAQLQAGLGGSYTLERELGRGGMATVFLAQDLKHDRPVALKVLHPELAMSLGPERFLREVKVAARLQHPHILSVHDSGETGGRLWFTMPFVEGESLRDRLRRERQLPVEDAIQIAREAARGLEYAHQHGVVHRDIKPENILLTRDGSTLVADFGIARALGGEDGLTQTGMAVGTPAYMSPEQAAGDKALDARTDEYSLAAVLYEMLAGESPWVGPTVQAMLAKKLSAAPSVRATRPSVAAAVDEAIRKALAPVPADRFGTLGQFAQALRQADGPGTRGVNVSEQADRSGAPTLATAPANVRQAAPAEPRRPRVSPAAVALVAGLLIGGGMLFAWRRSTVGGEPTAGHRIIAVLPFDNLGDSADGYFADGVSDEVRTKLGQVAGLEVIARGSSLEYRRTTKRPAEIAHELGADYLLTGTVRWEKSGGTNRVRVTPELVDARPGQAAHSKWGQQFDASLTDVFQVQGDIATKVADALGVALADSVRHELTAKPTDNLAAYDEYLKGEAASQAMASSDLPSLRRAIANYEHAVALDSTFAVAWARLSRARAAVFFNGIPTPELGVEARAAADRAIALQPNLADAYVALGDYYSEVTPIDNERALTEYKQGLRLNPDNTDLLGNIALTEWTLGRWDSVAYRLSRAVALDPRSVNTARRLAFTYLFQRNYKAADSAIDRAFALSPASPRLALIKAMIQVAQGNLAAARAVVGTAAAQIDPEIVLPFFANYQDFYWLL